MSSQHFKQLVEQGRPVGEVRAVNGFIVTVYGMQPSVINSLVLFDDDSKGVVHEIKDDCLIVLHFGQVQVLVGSNCTVLNNQLVANVGEGLLGRVINTNCEPIDGKGPLQVSSTLPVFGEAVSMFDRQHLDTLIPTGITVVDSMFPIVYGQRMALLGKSKIGKSTLASQIAINQKSNDTIVVMVLIAKKQSDIEEIVHRFTDSKVMDNCVIIASTIQDSLVMSYLVPYVGCAIAEYFWKFTNKDTIIFYDDLTSHAMICREIALLNGESPGRESYPGNMFYLHASLLERSGKLLSNGKSLTSIPIVLTPSSDITTFLPTNIMSITDGQWILDEELFLSGIKPAINLGLSVSRVGGRGTNILQKANLLRITRALASYRLAKEYSHFGSELALETRKDLVLGERILETLNQNPKESYTISAQQIMLEVILSTNEQTIIDIQALKDNANQLASNITDQTSYDKAISHLKLKCILENKDEL